MFKQQDLTVAELKSLLLARFSAEQSRMAKLRGRLQQEFGNKIQEEVPATIAIGNKFADFISEVLARRLKRNRRTTSLLSKRDLVRFIPLMIKEISKVADYEPDVDDRKIFEKFMKATFESVSEMVHAIVPSRKNPYEEYWRWVAVVLRLSAEHGVTPIELLSSEAANDEIARRMFTKKQFVTLSKRGMNKFVDADILKKIFVQPMLDMVAAEGDKEERRELEQELETELMPQLREIVEKTKIVINAWLGEEIERIYAEA